MKILMSIKPKYWAKIVSGEKGIEFRKVIPSCLHPDEFYQYTQLPSIVFYASAPTKRVVGEVTIWGAVLEKAFMWHEIYSRAGLTYDEIVAYCGGRDKTTWGLFMANVIVYDEPKTLQEAYPYIKRPPQNFCYLREE